MIARRCQGTESGMLFLVEALQACNVSRVWRTNICSKSHRLVLWAGIVGASSWIWVPCLEKTACRSLNMLCVRVPNKNLIHFSICACHPCAGAMLIFSVSFQFYRMILERSPNIQTAQYLCTETDVVPSEVLQTCHVIRVWRSD